MLSDSFSEEKKFLLLLDRIFTAEEKKFTTETDKRECEESIFKLFLAVAEKIKKKKKHCRKTRSTKPGNTNYFFLFSPDKRKQKY